MKTLGEVLTLSVQFLKERQCERARRTAEELLAFVLKLGRIDLYLQFDRPLQEEELEQCRALMKRKVKGEPLEYIVGKVSFYQCLFIVTPAVLIPRPETELLLEAVLKQEVKEGAVAWDICTGSGCLGVALKKQRPQLEVVLADISLEALVLAEKNALGNGVEVKVVQGDFLIPFQGQKADLILCNPPYVTEGEYAALDLSVRDYEPKIALVGGEDGLLFYRRLSEELPPLLNSGAQLFLEIGASQGAAVSALFSASCWKNKRIEKDLSGRDRFFFLEFE
jgi:release factor glutamine methyltransferase